MTQVWETCQVNGKLYGVASARVPGGLLTMTNDDLLATKGIDSSKIASGEDFLAACTEITDRSQGIFAIGQDAENWVVPVLLESLGGPNQWRQDGDTFISAYETDEYAKAIEIATTLWSEGAFHPESYTSGKTSTVPHGWFESGVSAFFTQTFASWAVKSATAPYEVGAVRWPQWNGGGPAKKLLGVPSSALPVGISKATPEARVVELLKFFDYMASPFGTQQFLNANFGAPGVQYTLTGNQIAPVQKPPRANLGGLDYVGTQRVRDLYVAGKPDITKKVHAYCADAFPTGVKDPTVGLFSETALAKGTVAQKGITDTIGSIVRGQTPMTAWSAAVETWRKAAGAAMATEYQAAAQNR